MKLFEWEDDRKRPWLALMGDDRLICKETKEDKERHKVAWKMVPTKPYNVVIVISSSA